MKTAEIAELAERARLRPQRKEKSGCARTRPGATAGGCSFDGAQIALLPIADVAHIVHGPIACAGASWDNRGARSSGPTLYRIGMTTDLTEQDVIMGRGEKRLFLAIKQAIDDYSPKAVFVYSTCVPALIGDDLEAVARAASERWGVPVVPVDCAGFYGTKNLGNRIAGEAMFKYVIGTREPEPLPRRRNGRDHGARREPDRRIQHCRRVLARGAAVRRTGLRILGTLSGDARFHEVQTMHRAQASMVVCAKALLNVARKLESDFGVPFFEGSFYGITDTSQAFRDFARAARRPGLTARTEAMIAREEAKIRAALEPWRARLAGKRVLLYTGGVKSWSVVSALQDLGMTVVATGTNKSTEEDKARIREIMGDDAKMITDGSPRRCCRLSRLPGGHPDRRRPQPVHGAESAHSLSRHQPGTRIRLRRLHRHARTGAPARADPRIAGLAQGAFAGAVGRAAGERQTAAVAGAPMAEILKRAKPLAVNPLKASQPIGAALAFLGLRGRFPMLHGSQGCTAFRQGVSGAPLSRTDPAADDGDGPGVGDHERRRERHRRPARALRKERAGADRPAHHRSLRNPGLRHASGWCASSAAAIRSSRRPPWCR
jgi:nitrogenase molybdenum-cofactor synthesis protein NifE